MMLIAVCEKNSSLQKILIVGFYLYVVVIRLYMKVMFIIFWSAYVLFTTVQPVCSLPDYDMDDNSVGGVRFSGNDQFSVLAVNNFERFALNFYPYKPSAELVMPYPLKSLYIYSVAVVSTNKNTSLSKKYEFASVGEEMTNQLLWIFYCFAESFDNTLAVGMF